MTQKRKNNAFITAWQTFKTRWEDFLWDFSMWRYRHRGIVESVKVAFWTLLICVAMIGFSYFFNIWLPEEVASGRNSWCHIARSFSSYTSRCMEELAAQNRNR